MAKGSNAPKPGQQGFQKTQPKLVLPKKTPSKETLSLKTFPHPNLSQQTANTAGVSDAFTKVEDVKKVAKRSRGLSGRKHERVDGQVNDLVNIKNDLDSYNTKYNRSAVKDLMAYQKLNGVLKSLPETGHFSHYEPEDADIVMKEILKKETTIDGSKILNSFAADTGNITDYLEDKEYIFTHSTIREKAETIALSEGVEHAETYLENMVNNFPETQKILDEFKGEYNLTKEESYFYEDDTYGEESYKEDVFNGEATP